MSEEKFHIGRQIARVIEQRRMMKCMLADKVGVSLSTIAHLTKRENIDMKLLQQIGEVLKYDFFQHYRNDAGQKQETDKDSLIAAQRLRIAELEQEIAAMKMLEIKAMKENYEELRQANKMLLAAMRPVSFNKSGNGLSWN